MRIDRSVYLPKAAFRASEKDINYFLDSPGQIGIIIEVNDMSRTEKQGDPLSRAQIYLSVIKKYSDFESTRSETKRSIENVDDKFEENIKPDKLFWRVLEKEAEYGEGSTKQQIMKLVF